MLWKCCQFFNTRVCILDFTHQLIESKGLKIRKWSLTHRLRQGRTRLLDVLAMIVVENVSHAQNSINYIFYRMIKFYCEPLFAILIEYFIVRLNSRIKFGIKNVLKIFLVSAASPCTLLKTESTETGKSVPEKKLPIINPLVRLPQWPSKYFVLNFR